jgi:putative ubiquitin-RnfH superfamily antitoxin RatB of RatAB toxin-antitoxin module
MATDSPLNVTVTVVYAVAPRCVSVSTVEVPAHSDVDAVIALSKVLEGVSPEQAHDLDISIWGRKVELRHRVREGDRIELTRALRVDPKVARRERFARQGARTTGLFKKPPKK